MKRLILALKISGWALGLYFLGDSLVCYLVYQADPAAFVAQSAPWYLPIQLNVLLAVLSLGAIAAIIWYLKRKTR